MTIFYKPFGGFRTVFCLAVLSFFCFVLPAVAEDSVFTVENVKVDVSAESALAAKDKAFEEAQVTAFKTMARRMLSQKEADALSVPDLMTLSTFIQDFEITKEKLSAVRYIGVYTFRFKDSAIKQYFANRGLSYTDVSSKPVLVLPFYQPGEKPVLWSEENPWLQAWSRAGGMKGLVPAVAPLGDLEDVQDVREERGLNYDPDGVINILSRYDAGQLVLAVAAPDSQNGNLNIHLYRAEKGAAVYVQDVAVEAVAGEDQTALFDRAVKQVHAALQKDWKNRMEAAPGEGNILQAVVPFNSPKEWAETQGALERVYGLDDVRLKSLSPRQARLELVYQGTEVRLRAALQQADIVLSIPPAPAFSAGVDATGVDAAGYTPSAPRIYELYLKRYAPSVPASGL